jgi:hypothetical protein
MLNLLLSSGFFFLNNMLHERGRVRRGSGAFQGFRVKHKSSSPMDNDVDNEHNIIATQIDEKRRHLVPNVV